MYYTHKPICCFQRFINIVVGTRGVGKTYDLSKWSIEIALAQHKPSFVWLRRYIKDADKISKEWWNDMEQEFPDYQFFNKGYDIYAKAKGGDSFKIGEVGAISDYVSFKGVPHPSVKLIVFDEFLTEEEGKYLPNEVDKFLNIVDSIVRTRDDCKVFLLANAVSMANPYFEWLGVKGDALENNFAKGKNYVIENCDYKEFQDYRRSTAFGSVINGSKYAEYSIDNKFLLDDVSDISEPPKGSIEPAYNLLLNGKLILVSYCGAFLYFSKGRDETFITYTFYPRDAKEGGAILLTKQSGRMREIINDFLAGRCLYKDLRTKNEIVLIVRQVYKNY